MILNVNDIFYRVATYIIIVIFLTFQVEAVMCHS
jgi:hypothetical protein